MIARLLALLALLATPAFAGDAARIVYLGIEEDQAYEPQLSYTGLSLKDRSRPIDGARLGFRDMRVLGRALKIQFELQEILLAPGTEPTSIARQLREIRPIAVLLDLPEPDMAAVVAAVDDTMPLLNIRHRAQRWRGERCAANLFHTIPSDAMLADALAQHLRARGWDELLLLHGGLPRDYELAEAARRSATKFGLRIVAERPFELTNDPRRRDLSNILLLTGGVAHDVVWIVDSAGEFGRYVPYATQAPRPIVGTEGLTPQAWHWTFERYGAPQLNQRFRRLAGRDMQAEDWAAWAAMRAVSSAVTAANSADAAAVANAMRSPDLAIDLYKGVRGNFRDWDGQLRQPILLATHNAVIEAAPLAGFEHQTDTLDTLGMDRAETDCVR